MANKRLTIDLPDGVPAKRRGQVRGRAPDIKAERRDGATLLTLYGSIEDGAADAFRAELSAITGDIVLRLHSPGGLVFDGIAMSNDLAAHRGHVRVEIPGLAASAASIVMLGADEIAIAASGHIMIHNAHSWAIGNAEDMRKESEVLESIDATLVATYAKRTGIPAAKLKAMLAAETWMRGPEAVDLRFADELLTTTDKTAKASFDLSQYKNVPPQILAAMTEPAIRAASAHITSRADLERRLRDGLGLSHGAARKIAAGGFSALSDNDNDINNLITIVADATRAIQKETRNNNVT